MITLFGYNTVNTLKVVAALEELQAEYEIKSVNIHQGEQHKAPFLVINPKAKVPAVIDDAGYGSNVTMAESVAILIYLSEKHSALLPSDNQERACALEWLFYQAIGDGADFWPMRILVSYCACSQPRDFGTLSISGRRRYRAY